MTTPCMCGGCDQCLSDQGFSFDDPEFGEETCPDCDGSGTIPDPDLKAGKVRYSTCSACNGRGTLTFEELSKFYER